MPLEFASLVIPETGADVVRCSDGLAILADGAGGTGGGRATAEWVVDFVATALANRAVSTEAQLRAVILEAALEAERRDSGQTTLIIACISRGRILGASVGDSEARLIGSGRNLTDGQSRKPLMGGGMPRVHTFDVELPARDLLVIGSDGLWKYSTRPLLVPALDRALDTVAPEFIDTARMPNGELQDDTSVILVRENQRPSREVESELARLFDSHDARRAPLSRELCAWVERFTPASDGAIAEAIERADDTLIIRGWDCDVTTQRWHPWLLRWRKGDWSLHLGISDFEAATPHSAVAFDETADWKRVVRWP